MADFVINKDFISKTLCENRAKPQMHCNGKCHLKKMMEKEDKQVTVQNENETLLFLEAITTFASLPTPSTQKHLLPKNDDRLSFIELSLFHPPTL